MHRHARLHQLVLAHGARRVLDRVEAHGDDRDGELRRVIASASTPSTRSNCYYWTPEETVAQEKPKETTWIIVIAVTGPVFGSTSNATM